ncbi:Alcohol dehydrogenase [Sporomusa silvacetica DSM 10669]|uniref:Alcohol dehydrogenase n=1 Tax=Sporomusa silvacetica DSM 10669 TaxID=1123289 RepID=A0ABZ3IGU6_9FIRM|nr:alcohol dehydrogenase [Sporomusa silvacetica]OZC13086.1 alcohol dehydrogenase [Sporomusa silvacetica DSM 10669]
MEQKTMKALVYHGPGEISLDDVPVPHIQKPTDVILKVTLSAICGSDVHIIEGHTPVKPPKIVGHEFCGEVVEIGSAVKKLKVGNKVAVSCIAYCGECYYCKNNNHVHCIDSDAACFGTQGNLDGAQAEYIRLPYAENYSYIIPEGMTEEDVLFVGDILSTGYYAAKKANIKPGDTIVVIGTGPVGMCAMETAKLFGPAKIIAVNRNQERLNYALECGIADIGLNPKKVDVVEEVRKLTDGHGADCVIEAMGIEQTFTTAIEAVKVGGTVSTVGVYSQPFLLQMQNYWMKNLTLNWGFVTVEHIPALIKLIQGGKINTKYLITHKAPLNDIVKGYDVFKNRKENCIKWLITPYER